MILNDFSAQQTKKKSALARRLRRGSALSGRNLTNLTNLTNNIKRLCTILNDLSDFSAKQTKKKSALARRNPTNLPNQTDIYKDFVKFERFLCEAD